MGVLYAVLYAHNASSSFRDQYFMLELIVFLLGYGQNIQSDWNINAAEFKNFIP